MKMELLRIKEVATEQGMTLGELAQKLGVSMTTVSMINTHKTWPRPELLLAISLALDVDIRDLFHPTKEAQKKLELYFKDEDGQLKPIEDLRG